MSDPATRLCLFVTPLVEHRKPSRFSGDRTLGEHAREAFSRFDAKQPSAIVAHLEWRLRRDGFHPIIGQALGAFWLAREAELAGHPRRHPVRPPGAVRPEGESIPCLRNGA